MHFDSASSSFVSLFLYLLLFIFSFTYTIRHSGLFCPETNRLVLFLYLCIQTWSSTFNIMSMTKANIDVFDSGTQWNRRSVPDDRTVVMATLVMAGNGTYRLTWC